MEKKCVIFVIKNCFLLIFFDLIWTWILNFLNLLDCGWTWMKFWKFRTRSGLQNIWQSAHLWSIGTTLANAFEKSKEKVVSWTERCKTTTKWKSPRWEANRKPLAKPTSNASAMLQRHCSFGDKLNVLFELCHVKQFNSHYPSLGVCIRLTLLGLQLRLRLR